MEMLFSVHVQQSVSFYQAQYRNQHFVSPCWRGRTSNSIICAAVLPRDQMWGAGSCMSALYCGTLACVAWRARRGRLTQPR